MSHLDCFALSQKLNRLSDVAHFQLECYLRFLQSRNYADGTLQLLVSSLRRFLKHLPERRQSLLAANLYLTSPKDVEDFVCSVARSNLAPSTINNTLSLLAAMFSYFIDEDQMLQQPVKRKHHVIAPTTLPKPIREDDLKKFFSVIDSIPDRLAFLLMLRCGLRISETTRLQWIDIDSSLGTVRINNGKGQFDRILYLSPDVLQTLTLWETACSHQKWLFPSPLVKNKPLSNKTIAYRMRNYLKKADITRHYSPHCLRHTFATQLLNAGIQLEVLKELMGHKSIAMTLCYTQVYESTKRQEYDQAMEQIEAKQTRLIAS